MFAASRRSFVLPAAVAALVILLVLLATLQYRWIREVSEADAQRRAASLAAAMERFAEDFDREVTRAFVAFQPEPVPAADGESLGTALAERYRDWLENAPYPRLVADVYVLSPRRGEREVGGNDGKLDPESGRLEPFTPPGELEPLLLRLEEGAGDGRNGRRRGPIFEEVPALVTFAGRPFRGRIVVIRLDRSYLESEFLPTLAERHFSGRNGLEVDLEISSRGEPARRIFVSDRSLPAEHFTRSDAGIGFFALRPFPEIQPVRPPRGPGFRDRRRLRPAFAGVDPEGRWHLGVRHRSGSLEAAVARVRRRNFALSLGILSLLGASLTMLAMAALKARRLAHQQLEFVAGITHELHTPLAAIRSAAQNLADGVIRDETRIREYGSLIEGQSRRLAGLVGEALEYAGMRSERRRLLRQPVEVRTLVEGALEDCRWFLKEKDARVERRIEAGLPPLEADPSALQRALHNLVENAAKYGGEKPKIVVRAEHLPAEAGGEIRLSVEDSGPGIHPRDLSRIFEPFYRGRRRHESRPSREGGGPSPPIEGSGLGLSLVKNTTEAHGGRVSIESSAGGTRITLHLPVASPAETLPEQTAEIEVEAPA